MQTFNEIKGELRKLHENRAILRKEEEKRFSDVRNIFQGDSLKETFAPYGVEVKTRHEYLCNYVYVIINNSQEILLFVCNDDFKNLKIKYLDDEGKFNKDYFFNYLRYTLNSYSYESFKESAALVEIYLKNVEKVLKESKICDVFNKYQDCLDKLNNVNKEIREKENLAEKAWILEKYGASRYDIQVGKSYYLYDSRKCRPYNGRILPRSRPRRRSPAWGSNPRSRWSGSRAEPDPSPWLPSGHGRCR